MCIKTQEYDGNIIAVMILIIQQMKYSGGLLRNLIIKN